jgi:hypothetical protein
MIIVAAMVNRRISRSTDGWPDSGKILEEGVVAFSHGAAPCVDLLLV